MKTITTQEIGAGSVHASTVLKRLRDLQIDEELARVDVQLAAMMLRRGLIPSWSEASTTAVAFGVALTSRACREGHSAIHLDQLLEQTALLVATVAEPGRNVAQWREALAVTALVGDGSTRTPLVLVNDLLQFARYYDAEARIAKQIVRRLTSRHKIAVPPLTIVTGGPGTGKTTHVARTIVELQHTQPSLRVALAAPTGKAAARLTESVRERMNEVASSGQSGIQPMGAARTLHRLLQYHPATDRYHRTEAAPLEDDLVIVDEASMVDVLMFDALLRAVKPESGIMLVGDHHQLASVDAGDVLGALCRVGLDGESNTPLREHIVVLTKSWRFASQPGIGALANAILAGDSATVLQVCRESKLEDIHHMSWPQSMDDLFAPVTPGLERCLGAQTPDEFLSALESFRILTPEREGTAGVSGINRSVEQWFSNRGHAMGGEWYHGRPVMVTANDYGTNIFNGDIGVVWRDAGHTAVYFRGDHGAMRIVSPTRLPDVETAWAVTVHKAQGSEFDSVLVIVPGHDSRIMSRELLYTAVTRARRQVTLVGAAGSIRQAVDRTSLRTSGLVQALQRLAEPSSGTKRGN